MKDFQINHKPSHLLHGQLVVEKLVTEEDVENFIMLWRKHFV
jgi:hypothetical protein